jgi:hypothetical protein
VSNFASEFRTYCALDPESNLELNAVEASFFGDFQTALDQATKKESVSTDPSERFSHAAGEMDKAQIIRTLQAEISNPNTTAENKSSAQTFLDLLTTPTVEELFASAKSLSAISYIVEKAKAHHFALINEAHYNSQHRAFTKELLKPLWEEGYRYLALEALGYEDTNLHERGYPILASGYYLKDSNFGNLVREALQLGYTLVAYETQNKHDGTPRDRDQAINIFEKTWKKDQKGKVLVHAGYSHISEAGDTDYEPMGLQLKRLLNQEILTIDQVQMVGLNDPLKLHPYYREAARKYELSEPMVFLSSKGEAIIDPILRLGTDVQVYHPTTKYELGRPHWMKNAKLKQIPLTSEFNAYKGFLVQALHQSEEEEAVPVDQFIIEKGRAFLLQPGKYNLRIINCEGELVGTAQLKID